MHLDLLRMRNVWQKQMHWSCINYVLTLVLTPMESATKWNNAYTITWCLFFILLKSSIKIYNFITLFRCNISRWVFPLFNVLHWVVILNKLKEKRKSEKQTWNIIFIKRLFFFSFKITPVRMEEWTQVY